MRPMDPAVAFATSASNTLPVISACRSLLSAFAVLLIATGNLYGQASKADSTALLSAAVKNTLRDAKSLRNLEIQQRMVSQWRRHETGGDSRRMVKPEQQLAELKKYSAGKTLTVQASMQGTGQNFSGKLSFIDNAVDLTTGTIKLKATFDNHEHALWPGQFVDCSLTLTSQPNAIVIPSAALQTGQNGTYVYVVEPDLTARVQPVKVARTLGDETVINSGLQPGQRIVTDGQLQVLPGNKVSIKSGS